MDFIYNVVRIFIVLSFCCSNAVGMDKFFNISDDDLTPQNKKIVLRNRIKREKLISSVEVIKQGERSAQELEMDQMMQEWSDKNLKTMNDNVMKVAEALLYQIDVNKSEILALKEENRRNKKNKKNFVGPSVEQAVFMVCIFIIGVALGYCGNKIMNN